MCAVEHRQQVYTVVACVHQSSTLSTSNTQRPTPNAQPPHPHPHQPNPQHQLRDVQGARGARVRRQQGQRGVPSRRRGMRGGGGRGGGRHRAGGAWWFGFHCLHVCPSGFLPVFTCTHSLVSKCMLAAARPPPHPPPLSSRNTPTQIGQAVTCNAAAAFQEFAVAKAAMCTPIPTPSPEAVAISLSAVTACCALDATAAVAAGQTVLVTAAAGGTGHFGVQLAKLAGARVVAVTGSPTKVERLRCLGADVVICHTTEVRLLVGGAAAGVAGGCS